MIRRQRLHEIYDIEKNEKNAREDLKESIWQRGAFIVQRKNSFVRRGGSQLTARQTLLSSTHLFGAS